jgi:hypothetical protein
LLRGYMHCEVQSVVFYSRDEESFVSDVWSSSTVTGLEEGLQRGDLVKGFLRREAKWRAWLTAVWWQSWKNADWAVLGRILVARGKDNEEACFEEKLEWR